jgi:hypothetical protein
LVADFLIEARAPEGSRGWTLLHPGTMRSMFGDNATTYIDAAASSDWSCLGRDILDAFADEVGLVTVIVDVDPDCPPDVLTHHRDNHWLLGADDAGKFQARMLVRFDEVGVGI